MTRPTLTIALPAYNEERTIGNVLRALLAQQRDAFTLDRIVVYTDGCTDHTTRIVKEIQQGAPEIQLVEDKVRHGKIYRVNQMFRECTSDLLMVLDADLGFEGNDFLNTFVKATFADTQSVMFVAHQIPLRPGTFEGKLYWAAFLMWDYIRLSVPEKDHVQNFYGAASIFRKSFLQAAQVPDVFKEMRTYIYLMAKKMGGFNYVDDAVIYYWPPHTARDFATLQNRAFGSDTIHLQKIFGPKAEHANTIPRIYKVIGLLKFIATHPLYALPALYINFHVSKGTREAQKTKEPSAIWEIVPSTKKPIHAAKVIISNYDDLKNPVYAGGGARAIHEVAKRLISNFDVTVLTGNYPDAKNEVLDGVAYVRIGLPYTVGPIGQLLYVPFLLWHVLTQKYDVWIESFTPPVSTSFVPLFTKKPVIGLVHMLSGKDMARKYHLPFTSIERLGIKLYRYIIALTDYSAKKIREQNPSAHIAVIGNGVDMPEHAIFNKGRHLSYLGRIEVNQKGLDLLLDAYAKACESISVPLVIAGIGSAKEVARLSSLIRERSLEKLVTLRGRITGKEKDTFLRETLIGIVPSRFETFSLTMLEMMSYGIPVVAFDTAGTRWAPDDTLVRVPAFDTRALAEAIIALYRNENFQEQLRAHATTYAARHTWDAIGQAYTAYITEVLTRHSV